MFDYIKKKFYLIKLATDVCLQPSYLLDERASLDLVYCLRIFSNMHNIITIYKQY